jgi:chemotaxis signal transduction protein
MEKFLHFVTGAQSFLLPLPSLHRIITQQRPKIVPFTPDYVGGILHFEGNIWVVLDLDVILGQSSGETLPELILVRQGDYRLAFRARRTRDIVTVDPEHREKRAVPGLPDACVAFVAVVDREFTYCLNLEGFVREFSVR